MEAEVGKGRRRARQRQGQAGWQRQPYTCRQGQAARQRKACRGNQTQVQEGKQRPEGAGGKAYAYRQSPAEARRCKKASIGKKGDWQSETDRYNLCRRRCMQMQTEADASRGSQAAS
jgi:hypothetical protein